MARTITANYLTGLTLTNAADTPLNPELSNLESFWALTVLGI